jgi:hypothetical protein
MAALHDIEFDAQRPRAGALHGAAADACSPIVLRDRLRA